MSDYIKDRPITKSLEEIHTLNKVRALMGLAPIPEPATTKLEVVK